MLETSSRLNLDQLMDGQHILHVSLDHLDQTQVLLMHGANPNIPDEKGWCPIHYATKRNFVETVMLLLQTGADIDLKTKEENIKEQKSALQIAVEYGAQACEDLLLFACAKISGKQDGENHDIADGLLDEENPEIPDGLLDQEDEENHKILMRGVNDGKISVGGGVFNVSAGSAFVPVESRTQTKMHMKIGQVKEAFIMQCREMEVDYQSSSIRIKPVNFTEDMTLVSRIYQYKVDKTVTCDVKVEIFENDDTTGQVRSTKQYKELIMQQTVEGSETKNDCVDLPRNSGNEVTIKGMTLYSNGISPVVAFGVFTQVRKENFTVGPNEKKKIQSAVESMFAVDVETGSAPSSTELELKVIKADDPPPLPRSESNSSVDSGYQSETSISSHSDFCSVRGIARRQPSLVSDNSGIVNSTDGGGGPGPSNTYELSDMGRPSSPDPHPDADTVVISLPKPPKKGVDNDGSLAVLRCNDGSNPLDVGCWNRTEHLEAINNKNSLQVQDGVMGCYIVVRVKRFSYLIRKLVRQMYENCVSDKKPCTILPLLKTVEEDGTFLIQVILCLETELEGILAKEQALQSGYVLSEHGPVNVEMNVRKTYMLKVKCNNTRKLTEDTFPIQCQGKSRPKSQIIEIGVEPNKRASGRVYCFKNHVPTSEQHYGLKSKVQFPIPFQPCKRHTILDSFLSDRFIKDAAKCVGDKWFELGLRFGFSCEEINCFAEVSDKNEKVLFVWRDDNTNANDRGLTKAMVAFKKAELPALRRKVLDEVLKWKDNDPDLNSWAEEYINDTPTMNNRTTGRQIVFDMNRLKQPHVSPLEDEFLLELCPVIERDLLFIQLGVKNVELMDHKEIKPAVRRKCLLLHIAKNRFGENGILKLLKQLYKELLPLHAEELQTEVSKWVKENEGNQQDGDQIRTLKKIFDIH